MSNRNLSVKVSLTILSLELKDRKKSLPTSPETLEPFGFVRVLDTSCEVLKLIAVLNQSSVLQVSGTKRVHVRLHASLDRVQGVLWKPQLLALSVSLYPDSVLRTATKVESTLLPLAASSVRYFFAQCFLCWMVGIIGKAVDCSGSFEGPSPPLCRRSTSAMFIMVGAELN